MAPAVSCPPSRTALFLLLFPALAAASPSEEDLFFKSVSEVNEGALHFLEQAPDRPVHHHRNHLFISDSSLSDGWVRLEQCHSHLDPVPSMQIVYGQDRIRNLRVQGSADIGKAWVHEHTVQMENLGPGASICIQAETRALGQDGQGNFSLANGPYMRRFLDGFYPMRVSVAVTLETERLRFLDITPPPQAGFQVRQEARQVGFDAYFEGMLRTVMRFSPVP